MKDCVRCWKRIEEDGKIRLWCDSCRKLVDQEFRKEVSRPFRFYFEHYRNEKATNMNHDSVWGLLKNHWTKELKD